MRRLRTCMNILHTQLSECWRCFDNSPSSIIRTKFTYAIRSVHYAEAIVTAQGEIAMANWIFLELRSWGEKKQRSANCIALNDSIFFSHFSSLFVSSAWLGNFIKSKNLCHANWFFRSDMKLIVSSRIHSMRILLLLSKDLFLSFFGWINWTRKDDDGEKEAGVWSDVSPRLQLPPWITASSFMLSWTGNVWT